MLGRGILFSPDSEPGFGGLVVPTPRDPVVEVERVMADRFRPVSIQPADFEKMLTVVKHETGFVPTAGAIRDFVGRQSRYLGPFRAEDEIFLVSDAKETKPVNVPTEKMLMWISHLGAQTWYPALDALFGSVMLKGVPTEDVNVRALRSPARHYFGGMMRLEDVHSVPAVRHRSSGVDFHSRGISEFVGHLQGYGEAVTEQLGHFVPFLKSSDAQRGLLSRPVLREALGRSLAQCELEQAERLVARVHRCYVKGIFDVHLERQVALRRDDEIFGGTQIGSTDEDWYLRFGGYAGSLPWIFNSLTALHLAHALAMPVSVRERLLAMYGG